MPRAANWHFVFLVSSIHNCGGKTNVFCLSEQPDILIPLKKWSLFFISTLRDKKRKFFDTYSLSIIEIYFRTKYLKEIIIVIEVIRLIFGGKGGGRGGEFYYQNKLSLTV